MDDNPLLRAVRAFEAASLEDAEYAIKLISGVMRRKRAAVASTMEDQAREPSVPARVEAALRHAGKPMTTSALATATGASELGIASAMSRSIKRKGKQSPFVRARNGVFALQEWRKTDRGDGT